MYPMDGQFQIPLLEENVIKNIDVVNGVINTAHTNSNGASVPSANPTVAAPAPTSNRRVSGAGVARRTSGAQV